MSASSVQQNGFTLIEALVSLVVAAILLTILFDGLASASKRSVRQVQQETSLSLAIEKLDSAGGGNTGKAGKLSWQLVEEIVASDPRGRYQLVRRKITIRNDAGHELVSLQKRILRPGQ